MYFHILLHLSVVLIVSPLLLGIIGKTKAFFAGRFGPPLLQPYYDLGKLFSKGSVYSTTTTWIFQAAPVLSLAAALVSSILMPLGALKAPLPFFGDVLLFVGLYAISRFVMIIAALDCGSSFEGMGAAREATFSCLAEIVLFLNFVTLGLLSKTLILSQMVDGSFASSWQATGPVLLLTGASYFMVLLTENARIPVDDPATHLELTMIHEVMVLDYSGLDLGIILYASAVKLFVLGALLINILIHTHQPSMLMETLGFLGGMMALALGIGIVESCMARLRLNRIPQLLMSALILALVGLLMVIIKGT